MDIGESRGVFFCGSEGVGLNRTEMNKCTCTDQSKKRKMDDENFFEVVEEAGVEEVSNG